MHRLKFTRHYYTLIHFKRIAEKYLLNLLNVCRPNFAVNHIFYQDYVPYIERGEPTYTLLSFMCPTATLSYMFWITLVTMQSLSLKM